MRTRRRKGTSGARGVREGCVTLSAVKGCTGAHPRGQRERLRAPDGLLFGLAGAEALLALGVLGAAEVRVEGEGDEEDGEEEERVLQPEEMEVPPGALGRHRLRQLHEAEGADAKDGQTNTRGVDGRRRVRHVRDQLEEERRGGCGKEPHEKEADRHLCRGTRRVQSVRGAGHGVSI